MMYRHNVPTISIWAKRRVPTKFVTRTFYPISASVFLPPFNTFSINLLNASWANLFTSTQFEFFAISSSIIKLASVYYRLSLRASHFLAFPIFIHFRIFGHCPCNHGYVSANTLFHQFFVGQFRIHSLCIFHPKLLHSGFYPKTQYFQNNPSSLKISSGSFGISTLTLNVLWFSQ